jgi:hypothetical protein
MSHKNEIESTSVNVIETEATGSELAKLIESNDEEAMIRELDGAVIQACVYRNKQGEAVLSYAGIKEVARNYKNIHLSVLQAECVMIKDWDDDLGSLVDVPCWVAKCSANNLKDNIRDESVIFQPVLVKRKSKDGKPAGHYVNQFAAQMAISKAKRNAIKAVVPTAYIEKMIQGFLAESKKPTTNPPSPSHQTQSTQQKAGQVSPTNPKKAQYTAQTVKQSFTSAPKKNEDLPGKATEVPPSKQSTKKGSTTERPFKEWKTWHILELDEGNNKPFKLYVEILFASGCKTEEHLFIFLTELLGKPIESILQIKPEQLREWIMTCTNKDPKKERLLKADLAKISRIVSVSLKKEGAA